MAEKHSSNTSFIPQDRIDNNPATSSICVQCKREFWHQKRHNRKYCSLQCAGIERRLTLITHGMCSTRLYNIWCKMKIRCHGTCKDNKRYKDRGIAVCDKWRNNFQAFYGWAMSHGYKDNLTIDRENGEGNYCPENCRWATRSQQSANCKHKSKRSNYRGLMPCGKRWSAYVRHKGKAAYLGTYDTQEEAALAYDKKAREIWGSFAIVNFSKPLRV